MFNALEKRLHQTRIGEIFYAENYVGFELSEQVRAYERETHTRFEFGDMFSRGLDHVLPIRRVA